MQILFVCLCMLVVNVAFSAIFGVGYYILLRIPKKVKYDIKRREKLR